MLNLCFLSIIVIDEIVTGNMYFAASEIAKSIIELLETYHSTEENNRDGTRDHDSMSPLLRVSFPGELHKHTSSI